MAAAPVNQQKQRADPAAIAAATDYAIQVAGHYVSWLSQTWGLGADTPRPLVGRRILELGPGPTLGAPALLACAGARVTVADRFLAGWDPDFHPEFLRALHDRLVDRGSDYCEPLLRMLEAADFRVVIECHAAGAEQLDRVDGVFDGVLSNAVLEHVEDLDATVRSLARKTAPGGCGFHQVDFRDHWSFDRPLEFLTENEQQFHADRDRGHCERGALWRQSDVVRAFEQGGFSVVAAPNLFASPEYVSEVRSRLQPRFAARSDEELRVISALFSVTRLQTAPMASTAPDEVFADASDGVEQIAVQIDLVADLFRRHNVGPANEGLARLSGDLRQFAQLVAMLGEGAGIDPTRLAINGVSPHAQLERLGRQLEDLVDAQSHEDWVTVADVLELDIQPMVRAWRERLLALAAPPS
jgi:SAM-dependent methyltransferase